MTGLVEQAIWDADVYQIEQTDPVVGGPPNLAQGQGITNVPHQALANRTAWLKAQIEALQQTLQDITNGAPGAMDTLNELAAALGDDPNFAATVLAEISKLKTPVASPVADNAALDVVNATSVLTAAQGALNPPLAIGGTIEHIELSDGSAIQKANRITPVGVFLTKHIRTRRTGTWSAWTADGIGLGITYPKWTTVLEGNEIEANGATLSRATYADLWDYAQNSGRLDATGVDPASFGPGDGATTFTLFDARGEFLRGLDNGRGVDAGRTIGSPQDHRLAWHKHAAGGFNNGAAYAFGHSGMYNSNYQIASSGGATGGLQWSSSAFDISSPPAPNATSNTIGTETRPRNIAQMFCIKF